MIELSCLQLSGLTYADIAPCHDYEANSKTFFLSLL